jgi:hypothetical protein
MTRLPLSFGLALLLAMPARAQAPLPEPVEIRVGSFNIWGLPGLLTTPRWRHRRSLVNRFLQQADFDVLAGQEVFDPAIDDLDPPPALSTEGGDAGLGFWFGGGVRLQGQGHTLHFRSRRGLERLKRKGVLGAELTLDNGLHIWVWNTHLQAYARPGAAAVRGAQVAELIELADAHPGPVILLGDFNLHGGFEPDGPVERALLSAGYRDVASELGLEAHGTWSDSDLRLDRIYLRDGGGTCFEALDYGVQRQIFEPGTAVSDHHPVWARLRVGPCE